MRSSEFFRAAFTGRFKEARDKTIHLRDTDIETFKAYIHWVYAKEVVLVTTEEAEADDEGQARMQKAVKLYVAADQPMIKDYGTLASTTSRKFWPTSRLCQGRTLLRKPTLLPPSSVS